MVQLAYVFARTALGLALAAGVGIAGEARGDGAGDCWGWQVVRDAEVGAQLPPYQPRFCFSGGGGVARLDAPTSSYLGVRNVATGTRGDFLRSNSTDTGGTFGGYFVYGGVASFVPSAPPASITVGGSYASFSQSSFVGHADPGANNLDIFGTGVDPFGPGFTVPPGPFGDFNDVFNNRYSRDVKRFDVFGQYNMPLLRAPGGTTIAALARVGYTRTDIDEHQSAELRNIPLHIQNGTEFGVNTFTPGVGFQVVAPVTSIVSVHVQGWAGAAFSDISGTDWFATSRLFNVTQQNPVSGSHVGFAGGVSGGFSLNLGGGYAAAATVSYLTTESHPIIVRTGQAGERSRYKVEDADSLGLHFRFVRDIRVNE